MNSSTVSETLRTATSLALMMVVALWSSSPEALGITNRVSTPLWAKPLTMPSQAVPRPPAIWGGNSQPNIKTLMVYTSFCLSNRYYTVRSAAVLSAEEMAPCGSWGGSPS